MGDGPSVNSPKYPHLRRCYIGSPDEGKGGDRGSSLSGTGPVRAGHVPCPDMPSNLNRVGPLADRLAPPATWLADGNLRLAVMRAVRNCSFSGELLTRYWRLPRPPLRFGLAVTAPAPCMLDCPARTKTLSGLFPGCWAAARSINPKRTGITVMFNKINRLIIFRPV